MSYPGTSILMWDCSWACSFSCRHDSITNPRYSWVDEHAINEWALLLFCIHIPWQLYFPHQLTDSCARSSTTYLVQGTEAPHRLFLFTLHIQHCATTLPPLSLFWWLSLISYQPRGRPHIGNTQRVHEDIQWSQRVLVGGGITKPPLLLLTKST